jgi:hypothetical protein
VNTRQAKSEWQRAGRSGWHYLFVFISVAVAGAVWCAIWLPFFALRKSLVPSDAFLFGGMTVGDALLYAIPVFPALAMSMLPGRFLIRLIPSARLTLEPELGDHTKTTRQQAKLAKWGVITFAAGLPFYFIGAVNFWAISPKLIKVRPIFSATLHSYDWSEVREIETGCTTGRYTNYHLILSLADGTRIDLLRDNFGGFADAYPKIQSALERQSYGFSNAGLASASCMSGLGPHWQEMLTLPPTCSPDR